MIPKTVSKENLKILKIKAQNNVVIFQ